MTEHLSTPQTVEDERCPHDLAERETACADGMCPICLASRSTPSPWIDCAERLPQTWDVGIPHDMVGPVKSQVVFVMTAIGATVAQLQNGMWINGETGEIEQTVTHWMPIPPLTEQQSARSTPDVENRD